MKKNYLFTLIFSLIISFSYSATYYVATAANGGSDGNSGTEASPWLTLAWAVSQAGSGDTINVGPGTFSSECNIHVTSSQSGLRIIDTRDETIFDGSSGNASCGFSDSDRCYFDEYDHSKLYNYFFWKCNLQCCRN